MLTALTVWRYRKLSWGRLLPQLGRRHDLRQSCLASLDFDFRYIMGWFITNSRLQRRWLGISWGSSQCEFLLRSVGLANAKLERESHSSSVEERPESCIDTQTWSKSIQGAKSPWVISPQCITINQMVSYKPYRPTNAYEETPCQTCHL